MEYQDKTTEIVNSIVKRKIRYKIRKQDVRWILKRYMHYVAVMIGNGLIVKTWGSHFYLHYQSLMYPMPRDMRKLGIRSGVCPYFYFFIRYGGNFSKYKYDYTPTRWFKKRVKKVIDSDMKLEIIPQSCRK